MRAQSPPIASESGVKVRGNCAYVRLAFFHGNATDTHYLIHCFVGEGKGAGLTFVGAGVRWMDVGGGKDGRAGHTGLCSYT